MKDNRKERCDVTEDARMKAQSETQKLDSSSRIGQPFRVVTYNIHKCRGLDRRVRPGRIAEVLAETSADIIALQEVWSVEEAIDEANQARYIAGELKMEMCAGINRSFRRGAYGNIVLSRLPLGASRNYDITWRGREARGCLRVDVQPGRAEKGDLHARGDATTPLHIFNVHLGTAFLERRHQARRLLDKDILGNRELTGARIVLGDFNEWTRGLASHLLATHFTAADTRTHLRRSRTYPGLMPLLHLDHIYYDSALELVNLNLHRTRLSLIASDHLPLVADFKLRSADFKLHSADRSSQVAPPVPRR